MTACCGWYSVGAVFHLRHQVDDAMLADDAGMRARAGDVEPITGDAGISLVADENVGAAL